MYLVLVLLLVLMLLLGLVNLYFPHCRAINSLFAPEEVGQWVVSATTCSWW
jgi:hypothetical protein